jgi:hypothetical protein
MATISENYNPDELTNSSSRFKNDSYFKVIKEEDLVLPDSDEEECGVAILNDEVMEDLKQLDIIKLEVEEPPKQVNPPVQS